MKDNPIRTPGIQSELALSSEFKRRAEIQYKWSSEDGDALKTPHGGPDPTRCYRPQVTYIAFMLRVAFRLQ